MKNQKFAWGVALIIGQVLWPTVAMSNWDIDHPAAMPVAQIVNTANVSADGNAGTSSTACNLFVEQRFNGGNNNLAWYEVGSQNGTSTSANESTWSITVNPDTNWSLDQTLEERIRLTWGGGGDAVTREIKFIQAP